MSNNQRILKNFSYLTLIQALSMLMPFVYYPYLIRVMGAELYGEFIYLQMLVGIVTIFIDFGFNLYGTKIVAECKGEKLNKIFSCIIFIKITLFAFLFPIYLLSVNLLLSDEGAIKLAFLMYFCALGEALFCQWYFQGKEKNHISAIIMMTSKVATLLAIFSLIKNENDLIYLIYITLLSFLFNGFTSLFYVVCFDKVNFESFSLKLYLSTIKGAYPFFLSRIVSNITLRLNGILVGEFLGMSMLAIYDLAMKMLNLVLLPIQMLNQALYPNVVKSKDYNLVFKLSSTLFGLSIIGYLISLVLYEPLIKMFAGNAMKNSIDVWIWVALIIPINSVSYFIGNCFLIVEGYNKHFNISIYVGFVFYFLCLLYLYTSNSWSLSYLSMSIVVNSLMIVIYRLYWTCRLRKSA